MKQRLASLMFIAGVFGIPKGNAPPYSIAANTGAGDFAAIDAYVEAEMRADRVPGAALTIVHGDQIVHGRALANVAANHSPGKAHEYSSPNYLVLGAIIERVSKKCIGLRFRTPVLRMRWVGASVKCTASPPCIMAASSRTFAARCHVAKFMWCEKTLGFMNADINLLFSSPVARVLDFKCREQAHTVSPVESASQFEINFIRKGRFGYRLNKKEYDFDSRTIMLVNAGAEQVFLHEHDVPDECTNIEVDAELLDEANTTFWKKEYAGHFKLPRVLLPRPILPLTPALDCLHANLFATIQRRRVAGMALKTETLLIRLIEEIYKTLYDRQREIRLDEKLKKRHLETVERARHFMLANYQRELTLAEIARHAFSSAFHFSRLFKQFTARSPHQYLLELRLQHALLLLRNTSLSVSEICFASGFNSFPHFIASFTRRYRMSPSKARS